MIGVSADTQETMDRFSESLELPYALVGDPEGAILKAYGVRWPVLGMARRVTFVIGRERKIERVFESQFEVERHVQTACAAVGA